jgi:hypothetical protein
VLKVTTRKAHGDMWFEHKAELDCGKEFEAVLREICRWVI